MRKGRLQSKLLHRIAVVAGLGLVCGLSACTLPTSVAQLREFFKPPRSEAPLPAVALAVGEFEAALGQTSFGDSERASLLRLSKIAQIFYQRLSHRRLNSIATFHDPALREFFRSEEAFADYYADLVQKLDLEHFEANRPNEIEMQTFHVEETADRVVIVVEFRGENALPLRFWAVDYLRRDIWARAGNRWWIIPGKL